MNSKLIELYAREIKVEELELNSKENGERMKQSHLSTNILIEEVKYEKEQMAVELESLRKENEQLMLENITHKKRQDDQKTKITEIRELNDQKKNQLAEQLTRYEAEIEKIVAENQRFNDAYRNL